MIISKFLDPKNDLCFKNIFGTNKNKNILIHFINDILGFTGEDAIEKVHFLSTIMNPEIASDKQSIVDILCKDSRGTRYVVEMQVARDKGFEKRAQLYASQAYSKQLDKGDNYIDLKKVYFIAISNCKLFPEEDDYISRHNIRDIKTNGHYLKDFEYIFIELPKFPKKEVDQLENIIERWCYFFKHAEDTTDEELKKIEEQAPIIKLAYDELYKFGLNKKNRAAYEERILTVLKEQNIWKQRLDNAAEIGKKEGREEGIQIGEERGKIEVAKSMLADNVDVNTIAKFTGLSPDEIKKLLKESAL